MSQLDLHYLLYVFAGQAVEGDGVVHPIQELRFEARLQGLGHPVLHLLLGDIRIQNPLAADIEVMMTTAFLKSTVRPWPSVSLPSSIICRSMLKTSAWAFSISSINMTCLLYTSPSPRD